MRRTLFGIVHTAFLCTALAQQGEFVVNSTLDSTQREPRLARDAAGNSVVVWTSRDQAAPGSKGDVYLQWLTPADQKAGPETRVNERTAGDQQKPAVAMSPAGDVVIVWATFTDADSMYDIAARVYPAGGPPGAEFLVNTTRRLTQTNPSVAVDSTGAFVVVWDSWEQDGSDRGVYGRRFAASGAPLGGEFPVNTTTAYSQARPAVRFLTGGRFLVAWESWRQDVPGASGYGVFGRLWDRSGTPLSGEIPFNSYTADYQWLADVSPREDGGFVAAWCSWGQDGSGGAVVAQRFNAGGQKVGDEILVNRTTQDYQWLPKVVCFTGGEFAVVWSSMKQDGDKEGIAAQLCDAAGRRTSLELRVNQDTAGFQWEPAAVATGPRELLVVWSGWGKTGHDYDVVARRFSLAPTQGYIDPSGYAHAAGRSTSRILVHVMDSLALTGSTYEAMFDSLGYGNARLTVRKSVTGDTLVRQFPINRGTGVFYATPSFEGVSLEVMPEFDFAVNSSGSFFANHSGSTISFSAAPSTGTVRLAPIDVAVVWGPPDTLAGGAYAAPLDTALNLSGQRVVAVPFRAWNLTDGGRLDLLVSVTSASGIKKWSPGQKITLLTPPPYRVTAFDKHADLNSAAGAGLLAMPRPGDTCYVLTRRPIRSGERYTFVTSKATVLDVPPAAGLERTFSLSPNYPNPFNPLTTIRYTVPGNGRVVLRVYNLLGQQVALLVDGVQAPGLHRAQFDGRNLASGVYFCRLEYGHSMIVQKMMLLK